VVYAWLLQWLHVELLYQPGTSRNLDELLPLGLRRPRRSLDHIALELESGWISKSRMRRQNSFGGQNPMSVLPNVLIVIAVLLTAGLGYFLSLPTPGAPDRAGLAVVLPILQTPRWICLAFLMSLCVARGAFVWPAGRAGQYFVVLAVHVLIGIVAVVGTAILMDQNSQSTKVPHWVGYLAQVPAFVIPLLQMIFAAWILNPALRGNLDPGTVRTVNHRAIAGFALLISGLGVIATIAVLNGLARDARERAQNPRPENTTEISKEIAEEQKFRSLAPDAPISEWLPYTAYGTPEGRKNSALKALSQRPRLVEELSTELASENWDTVKQALYAIELLPPAPPARLAEPFHKTGRRIVEGLQDAESSRWSMEERDRILAQWDVCTGAYIAAARGLNQAGVDVRPVLRTIVEAAHKYDNVHAREIVRVYDFYVQEFAGKAARP
jgi:hypothetical protein